jgi:hypothetical protein
MNNVKSIITKHNAYIARKNKPQDKDIVNCGCLGGTVYPLWRTY